MKKIRRKSSFLKKITDPDKVCWYAPEIGANTVRLQHQDSLCTQFTISLYSFKRRRRSHAMAPQPNLEPSLSALQSHLLDGCQLATKEKRYCQKQSFQSK